MSYSAKFEPKRALSSWFSPLGASRLLSAADERELARQVHGGGIGSRLAFDALVAGNVRLVISVARQYSGAGLPLEDAIQEGNVGLMRAARKFDGARGVRFATYATWWIKQAIMRARDAQQTVIRIPSYKIENIQRLNRTRRHLRSKLGREPTVLEIAGFMGAKAADVDALLAVRVDVLHLDRPMQDGDQPAHHLVADPKAEDLDAGIEERELRRDLDAALATLSAREEAVIRLRFAYGEARACSLNEIGRRFGVSRERIRQLESRALQKLRHPSRSRHFGG